MLLVSPKGKFLKTTWRWARGFAAFAAITVDMDVKRAKLMILCLEWTISWGGAKELPIGQYLDEDEEEDSDDPDDYDEEDETE